MRAFVLVTVVTLFGIAGCGGSDPEVRVGAGSGSTEPSADGQVQSVPPDGRADITGPVASATPFVAVTEDCTDPGDLPPDAAVSSDDPPLCTAEDSDMVGSVLIAKGTGSVDAASISVTTSTRILAADGAGGWTPTSFDRVEPGTRVRVWFTGPVAESYPVQATAAVLTLEP